MVSQQLIYILVGALFSAISTLTLSTYQEYKQSERTRRALYAEMESMEDLLKRLVEEERGNRSVRTQVEEQVSTKMYDQHLSNLGRLSDDEIADVIAFYQQMNYIVDSHQTYNEVRAADTPEDREERKRQSTDEWFSSYSISMSAEKALGNLQSAQDARKDITFWGYVFRRWNN